MQIYRHFEDLPKQAQGAVVAVGNFDGVHLGHQAVIGEAGRCARDIDVPWAVLTFEPHPRAFFGTEPEPFRLTPFKTKARQIEQLGVDVMVVLSFDQDFAKLEAESFVHDVLVGGLAARHVVSGYDFVFGAGRKGNCELLLKMGADEEFDFTCVRPVHDDSGTAYSSTRVREFLLSGDPKGAAQLLGRPFEIEGIVEKGDQRGQTIGFATANLHLGEYLQPAKGVYAVRAGIEQDGTLVWLDGAANLGLRPTFGGEDIVLETHIFDYKGDIYGQHLRIQLVDYLRPEKKFGDVDDLKAQIAADCENARDRLNGL